MPERLVQICRRALAVSPRDRYPSTRELQIELESFLADNESDAQQEAGRGALSELMVGWFAAEGTEMLTLSLAPEPVREPPPAPPRPAAVPIAPSATFAAAPELPAALSPVVPVVPHDPDTSGHRAYSSTLQPAPERPAARRAGWLTGALVPLSVAALLALLVQGVRMIRRAQPAPDAALVQGTSARETNTPATPPQVAPAVAAPEAPTAPAVVELSLQPAAAPPPTGVDAELPAFLASQHEAPEPARADQDPSLITLSAAPQAAIEKRRVRREPRKALPKPDARGARASELAPSTSDVAPRSIGEIDPYTD